MHKLPPITPQNIVPLRQRNNRHQIEKKPIVGQKDAAKQIEVLQSEKQVKRGIQHKLNEVNRPKHQKNREFSETNTLNLPKGGSYTIKIFKNYIFFNFQMP